jgi:hypothetical protein
LTKLSEKITQPVDDNWQKKGKPMQDHQAQLDDDIHPELELIAQQIWRLKGSPQQDEAGGNADYLAAIELEPNS